MSLCNSELPLIALLWSILGLGVNQAAACMCQCAEGSYRRFTWEVPESCFSSSIPRHGRVGAHLDDICVVQELSTVTSYTFLFPTRLCYYSHTAGSSPSPKVQFRVFIFGQANAGPSGHPIDHWHARRKLVLYCTLSAKWMSSQKHTFCRVCVIQRAAQVC